MSTNAVALQCVAIPLHGCAPGCGRNYAILPEQRQGLLTPRGPTDLQEAPKPFEDGTMFS
ncbi:unnamed protein product, partial [Prorocentrum cordatum]